MATFTDAEIQQLITEYEGLRDAARQLSEAERERLAALREQLTILGEIERLNQQEIQNQERIRDVLQERVNTATNSVEVSIRRNALMEQNLNLARLERDELERMALSSEGLTDSEEKRLKLLRESIELQIMANEAVRENDELVNSIGSAFDQKIMKGVMKMTDLFNRPMDEKMKALNNTLNAVADVGLSRIISMATDLVFQFDELTKQFERQMQLGPAYTQSIEEQFTALNEYGVTIEDAVEAQKELATSFTDFTMLSKNQRDMISENSLVLNELGVAQSDFAKGIQSSTKFFGQSADAAVVTQRELMATARALGREPGALAAEFAQAGPALAKFGSDGVKAFKDLSRISKLTGMEMEKVLSITNRFDTFEGAAEMAGQLNAALGGNFVNAMDMMMETDPAARFESIRDAITGAGLTFDDMSYYQKQFYTEALGLSDVGDLAMMLSGNMDDLAGSTNKSAEALIEEKKKAKEVQSAQEELAIMGRELVKAFLPFAELLQKITGFLGENLFIVKLLIPFLAAYKAVTLALAIQKAFLTVTTGSLAAAEAAQATNGKRAAITLGIVALAIAALATYLMISSPSKVVLALFGMAAALFAIGKVGEKVGIGLKVAAGSMLAIGTGAFLAGAGLGIMAAGFSLLSFEQMMGMSVALLSFAGALYIAGPALSAFGAAAAFATPFILAAAPALGVMAIFIAAVAGSIFIAAAGIGLMGAGLAVMFEALYVEKTIAFGAVLVTMAMAGPLLFLAGAGLMGVGAGMLMLGAALAFIPTRDLEAIASFATGLAELNVSNIQALVSALREVATAMDDIPTAKAIALTATMASAEVAANAAARLAGTTPPAAAPAATGGANNAGQPINVHVRLELDGEVLDERIVKTTTNAKSSGGALDVVAGILN